MRPIAEVTTDQFGRHLGSHRPIQFWAFSLGQRIFVSSPNNRYPATITYLTSMSWPLLGVPGEGLTTVPGYRVDAGRLGDHLVPEMWVEFSATGVLSSRFQGKLKAAR